MKTYKYAEGQPCPCGSTIGKDHYCRDCGFGHDPDAPCGDGIMIDSDDLQTKLDQIEVEENSFLVVKVGNDSHPATKDDIILAREILTGNTKGSFG